MMCSCCDRRQRRQRSSSSTLCYYITAVVLLQNTLMAYNIARRANTAALSTPPQTVANWTTIQPDKGAGVQSGVLGRVEAPSMISRNISFSFERFEFEKVPKTERMYYRKRPTKVNPYVHKMLLMPTHRLCDASTVMLTLVNSGTRNIAQRAAIRETWGSAASTGSWPNQQQNGSCAGLRLAFVLGLSGDAATNHAIQQEHSNHNDIVQGDFVDNYHNMTLKSLLGLKVAAEHCPNVRYLLKTDDDMIVNLPYLLQLLANKGLQRSIMGPVNVGAGVHRSGKWKLTPEEFPFKRFPPYESGSAYIITGDVIHELFVTSEYVPHIFVDDVYVTGILGRVIGINHVMHRGFAFWHGKPPSVCDIVLNRVVSGTRMTPALLRDIWRQLNKPVNCPVS